MQRISLYLTVTLSALLALYTPFGATLTWAQHGQMYEGMHAPTTSEPKAKPPDMAAPMDMGKMQGGSAPAGARDPNAYSEGHEYAGMPGMEKTDKIVFGSLLLDQLEYTHSSKGDGFAWDAYAWYGNDENKLHLRSEGGTVNGSVDETTGAEALWWRPLTAFWATVAGVRQDFGAGSHTHLAAGVEGIAPYWLHIQATIYLADNGGISARLKGEYDILITNRLILALELESNIFSRSNDRRGTGAGLGNIEPQVRLRYEFSRKFAPYIGIDWDRALGDTADRRRVEGESVSETRFVAGVRMLW